MKWRKLGKLLGFVTRNKILKIYGVVGKEFLFVLEFEKKIPNFQFYKENMILVINSDGDSIYEYEYELDTVKTLIEPQKFKF